MSDATATNLQDVDPMANRNDKMMATVVAEYAAAKSRQNIDDALHLCTKDFALYAEAFNSAARGEADVRRQLEQFFKTFPDYSVVLEGSASNGYGYGHACWGTLRMSMHGRIARWAPTGRTATLPFYCLFTFKDEKIASEKFFFNQEDLCQQLGLPRPQFHILTRFASFLPVRLQVKL